MFLDCFKEQKQNLQVRAKKIKRRLVGISESWVLGGRQAGRIHGLSSI